MTEAPEGSPQTRERLRVGFTYLERLGLSEKDFSANSTKFVEDINEDRESCRTFFDRAQFENAKYARATGERRGHIKRIDVGIIPNTRVQNAAVNFVNFQFPVSVDYYMGGIAVEPGEEGRPDAYTLLISTQESMGSVEIRVEGDNYEVFALRRGTYPDVPGKTPEEVRRAFERSEDDPTKRVTYEKVETEQGKNEILDRIAVKPTELTSKNIESQLRLQL